MTDKEMVPRRTQGLLVEPGTAVAVSPRTQILVRSETNAHRSNATDPMSCQETEKR
jgi:hypothetical protein